MYYIYEIPGVKIGCTKRWHERSFSQRKKGVMVELERYDSLEVAARREYELQIEKGYMKDIHPYDEWIKMATNKRPTKAVRAFKVLERVKESSYVVIRRKEEIGEYNSVSDTAEAISTILGKPVYAANICDVLNPNMPAKTYRGYTFEYA